MLNLHPENIDDLTPERTRSIMERSMEDISSIFEETRLIVNDIKANGDAVALKHYRKHKADITSADLEVTREEIEEAYKQIDTKVVDCLLGKFVAAVLQLGFVFFPTGA